MNQKTLVAHHYVATDADIRTLADDYVQSLSSGESVRQTYLRALIATTQKELGAKPRADNAPRRGTLSDEERERQLTALVAVHERFYAIVNDVVDKSLDDVPSKERAQVRNSRTNFARTALYAARRYVRAGKDLTALAPGKLNKRAMAVQIASTRRPSVKRLKNRVEKGSKAFMRALLELSESDQQAAVAELDTLIGQMATQLAAMGVEAVRNPKAAVEKHVPLRVGSHIFLPTATTVLRQRARPS